MGSLEKTLGWFFFVLIVLGLTFMGVVLWAIVEIVQWMTSK